MIKRLFLTALLVFMISWVSFANEQKKITLNNSDHKTDTITIELADCSCNIFVSLKDVDENNRATITIEIENTHESNFLLLFEKAYDEKALKKMIPSITYDKIFSGSKGERKISVCEDLRSPIIIPPSEKKKLYEKTGTDKDSIVCELPFYIAKNKNKRGSKILLLEKFVIELEIYAQDEEYIRITDSYDALKKEIDTVTFCTNKYHKGESFKSLKRKYEGRITALKNDIAEIVKERFDAGKDIKKFKDVYDKLDAISFDPVSSCSNDYKPSGHSCKNCNLTYEQIYDKLENYFIDIYNGKKTKAKVMSDVESLYACVLKNTKRPANKMLKEGIIQYYNKIKAL